MNEVKNTFVIAIDNCLLKATAKVRQQQEIRKDRKTRAQVSGCGGRVDDKGELQEDKGEDKTFIRSRRIHKKSP